MTIHTEGPILYFVNPKTLGHSMEVVSPGFEPRSAGPEPTMMDRYTKRLAIKAKSLSFLK